MLLVKNVFAFDHGIKLIDEIETNNHEIAIVQLSFDGINTQHCGVGTVVLQTQEILKELNKRYNNRVHFKLYLLSANYSEQLPEYSGKVLEENIHVCRESGGDVYLIPTTINNEMFGHPTQWEELCKDGAKLCAQIINQNTHTIIIAHDTAYAHIPLELKHLSMKGEIENTYQTIWVPHATSWKYNGHTPEGLPKWPERHEWELKAFQKAKDYSYQIGYISPTIQQDIVSFPFNMDESQLIHYKTGILLDPYLKPISRSEIANKLIEKSIPLDKRLIFSIGRATPLKGHDITLEVYRHLKQQYSDIHLVMLAPSSDYMPEFLQLLKDKIKKERLEITLIDQFDPSLDYYIYQWPKTVMLCLLSRTDTQPLTIMEGRANPTNSILLTSSGERMGKQVTDGVDGFTCSLDGLEKIIDKPLDSSPAIHQIVASACHILDLPKEERAKMIEAGKKLIFEKYNIRQNVIDNLNCLLKNRQLGQQFLVDHIRNLSNNSEQIQKIYGLTGELIFEELQGGMVNPPIAIFRKSSPPIGILKAKLGNEQTMAIRLKIISDILSQGFSHLPHILRDKEGCLLTKIGDAFYSFYEFIPADAAPISFQEILEITGKFHQKTNNISPPQLLKKTKLDEYLNRCEIFLNPWFKLYHSDLFSDFLWESICKVGQYFASEKFQKLYNDLPFQLIHGDNNQTNIIKSGDNLYFIDFDSLRYDARVLDLASYFRYGGFSNYVNLTENNQLFQTLNQLYGQTAGCLLDVEKKSFHKMVVFSHIEFISWAMHSLKKASEEQEQDKIEKMKSYISDYRNQMKHLFEIFKDWENL